MKRRDFIKTLPLGVAAASIPFSIGGLFSGKAFGRSPALDTLLNTQTDTNNILVIINLQGGNDGLNTVIPFQDPIYDANRADIGYVSSADKALLTPYQLRGNLAINPPLGTNFYNMFHDGKLAVLQNVGYANPNRSHFRATDIWNSASDSETVVFTGWMGRYLETQVPDNYPLSIHPGDDPLAIAIDYATTLIFQGGKSVMASAVLDPSKYNAAVYYDDTPPKTNAGAELGFVRSILKASDAYGKRFSEVFDTTTHPNATKNTVAYPSGNPLAVQLQKVAWCINAGLKTRVYFVTLGGFDTHVSQNSKDPSVGQGLLHKSLGEAISIFQKDLENMSLADRVIGMTYSEFGRRVNQNGSQGTDHGTAAPMFLFGKSINGELYGNNPNLDPAHLDQYGDLIQQFDFRQVYAALLTQWFGVDDNLRKAILNKVPNFTQTPDFKDPNLGFQFPINGSNTVQNLIRNPVQGVSSAQTVPFSLYQNQPNPFIGVTTIKFALSEAGRVLLEVYDGRGAHVSTVLNSYMGRGENQAVFDGRNLSSGTYYCRLEVSGAVQTKAMVLLK